MAVTPIPKGYHSLTPYLMVRDIPQQMDFLQRAFDAKVSHRIAMPDGSVMHADLMIGDSHVMLGVAHGEWQPTQAGIVLYTPNCDAVYQRAIQAGATSVHEPKDQFYGDRMGGVKDPAGNVWWISTHIEEMSDEEMQRRSQAAMAQRKG